jgi:hypothetical protein
MTACQATSPNEDAVQQLPPDQQAADAGGGAAGGVGEGGGGAPSGGTPGTGGANGGNGGNGGASGGVPGGQGGEGGEGGGAGGGGPGGDADADGVPDARDNCPAVANAHQRDADGDGTGDACDDGDADQDGVPDSEDLCPALDLRPVDTDGDGVGDQCDLCPEVADPDQTDSDGDGKSDACEDPADMDEDGARLPDDNCPEVANADQADRDVDGRGDACDLCPDAPDFSQRDIDGDGLGDACDVCPDAPDDGRNHRDADGDGTPPCALDCDDTRRDVRPGAAEVCNGLDDDCDGAADEDFDGLGLACRAGQGACAAEGVFACGPGGAGVACDAMPGRPSAELCNDLDDDCDGQTDEGLAGCCDPGEAVPCGSDVGRCERGTQVCGPDREYGACDALGPFVEICNGQDDDCDGLTDEDQPRQACGVGRCRHDAAGCVDGSPVACDPFEGAMPESCNGQDDDCDGTTDEGFDLQNDPRNCGRCGVVCAGGESCEAGRCLGAEPRVRLCGASARDPATFLRAEAAGFVYSADGCRLEGTQTLLVSRFGLDAFTRLVGVRAFLENGGVVVGEYTTSATLTQAVFGVPVPLGAVEGACADEPSFPRVFNRDDPLWRAHPPYQAVATGCGHAIGVDALPGLVPLGGHSRQTVQLAYINVGRGRLWLVEVDWADGQPLSDAGLDVMGYIVSGGAELGPPACRNGLDDDANGLIDLNDPGCEALDDATEAPAGARACSDGVDNDGNGSFDFPYDAGCTGAGDPTEVPPVRAPACDNGVDDDADGYTDFPIDYGCEGRGDDDEVARMPAPACGDLLDNDADGTVDYTRDGLCESSMDPSEAW